MPSNFTPSWRRRDAAAGVREPAAHLGLARVGFWLLVLIAVAGVLAHIGSAR